MFKDSEYISGIELRGEYFGTDLAGDWAPLNYVFGDYNRVSEYEEADITEEVLRIGLHFDRTEADQTLKAISLQGETMNIDIKVHDFVYEDAGWFDLTGRFIGLAVHKGFAADGSTYAIRKIEARSDQSSCELSVMDPAITQLTMSQAIAPYIPETIDTYDFSFPTPFGTFCSLAVTLDEQPSEISWTGLTMTMTSTSST